VNIKIGIWNKIKQDLAEGRIDALPLVGRTSEREELYDFTMSYLSLHGAVFVRKGTKDIHSIADLKNKSIVVMKGDNAEEFVRRENISEEIVTTKTFEEAFIALAKGHHDAVITQRVMGIELLKKRGIRNVVPLDFHLPKFRQDFCFAVQKGNTQLLSRLNEGLSIIIATDTFEEIRHKWFGPTFKQKIAFKDILNYLLFILIPLIILFFVVAVILLRKEVKRQTKELKNEITERKKAEDELVQLKNQLKKTLEERTAELEEKVQKLDKSEKAMLYLVEDLNDLTAQLEEERRKLLISNQELEAFTYSVSHDLRAPLRAVDGYSKFLLEDYADKLHKEGKRFIQVIRKNTTKMDRLIIDLLSLSRVSRADMNLIQVDMGEIAASMFKEIASEEEQKGFQLTIKKMPPVFCDIDLIKQVWQNLISNAIKYSSKSEIKEIEIKATQKALEIIFCISDHGAGFDEKYVDKLFGVFQRLHSEEEFPGTGVGLAIVKRIIQRHGGRVWAEGNVNQGATFYFSLPQPGFRGQRSEVRGQKSEVGFK
ncbi:MAG: transporter substrate-binding domain-containing protein, partial [bacterium]|nr:transporter substrate-binding domain-containing protein [bacterium]